MKFLLVRLTALGDVVQTMPVIEALSERFPESEIHWIVEEGAFPLLQGHPHLHRVWKFPRREIKILLQGHLSLWPTLRKKWTLLWRERFDWIFDFQGNLRSALLTSLLPGRHKVGYAPPVSREGSFLFYHRTFQVDFQLHKTERCFSLLEQALGVSLPEPRPPVFPSRFYSKTLGDWLPKEGKILLIHPGVSRKYRIKAWPLPYYKELVERVFKAYPSVHVVLSFGPSEEAVVEYFRRHLGNGLVIPPYPLPLEELFALLQKVDLMVASDTGPLHLAASLGTPVIGLYGPKPLSIYRPYFQGRGIISQSPDCVPCNRKSCPYVKRYAPCMEAISPEEVWQEVKKWL